MKWKLSAGSEENKIIHYRCFIKLEIIEQATEFIFLGFFFKQSIHNLTLFHLNNYHFYMSITIFLS